MYRASLKVPQTPQCHSVQAHLRISRLFLCGRSRLSNQDAGPDPTDRLPFRYCNRGGWGRDACLEMRGPPTDTTALSGEPMQSNSGKCSQVFFACSVFLRFQFIKCVLCVTWALFAGQQQPSPACKELVHHQSSSAE